MDFIIAAQDIGVMSLGLLSEQSELIEEAFPIAPEQYLQTIDQFLEKHQIQLEKVKRILIVPGPGSFTASRVSVTIANTIAFTHKIPMISIPNPEKKSLRELCIDLSHQNPPETLFVAPLYDRPPMITQAKSQVL